VLVERLVAGDPPEHLGRRAVLGDIAGVVVVDLVVVPRHDEREAGVRPLQVAVGLVERVAQPELVERDGFVGVLRRQLDAPDAAGRRVDAVLVRVVAEEDDQVEVLLGHVGVGVVEALLALLARGVRERHPVEAVVGRGGRARPGERRGPVAGREPVPVLAAGLQAAHVDVHGVRQVGRRDGAAAPDHPAHALVAGHLPAELEVAGPAQPAVRGQRLGRQAGPEHDAVGQRVAGCDPERERVRLQPGRTRAPAGQRLLAAERDEDPRRRRPCQQLPPRDWAATRHRAPPLVEHPRACRARARGRQRGV
jgi:hypothetical protein